MSIRKELAPRIENTQQTATAAEIAASTLYEWLAGKRKRRLGDEQLDRLADTLGAEWRLIQKGKP